MLLPIFFPLVSVTFSPGNEGETFVKATRVGVQTIPPHSRTECLRSAKRFSCRRLNACIVKCDGAHHESCREFPVFTSVYESNRSREKVGTLSSRPNSAALPSYVSPPASRLPSRRPRLVAKRASCVCARPSVVDIMPATPPIKLREMPCCVGEATEAVRRWRGRRICLQMCLNCVHNLVLRIREHSLRVLSTRTERGGEEGGRRRERREVFRRIGIGRGQTWAVQHGASYPCKSRNVYYHAEVPPKIIGEGECAAHEPLGVLVCLDPNCIWYHGRVVQGLRG